MASLLLIAGSPSPGQCLAATAPLDAPRAPAEGAVIPDSLDAAKARLREGNYGDAESLARAILARLGMDDHADSLEAAATLDVLVEALRKLGKVRGPEPHEIASRAVLLKERLFGPDHPETATSINAQGRLLFSAGETAAARLSLERALAIREKALGPGHPDVAASLSGLGRVLARQGRAAEARRAYERALSIREESLGTDHPDVAWSLIDLADIANTMQEARPLYERAASILERALGANHPDLAIPIGNLGETIFYQGGDVAEARALFERALALSERWLGPDHPEVALNLVRLAELLNGLGEFAAAKPMLERSLAIWETALGADHPAVAWPLTTLGVWYHSRGDYAKARPLYERALTIREKAHGKDHPNIAYTLQHLGVLLCTIGDCVAARPLLERALKIREQAFGSGNVEVAHILNDLAWALQATGEYSMARRHYERALEIGTKLFGPESELVTRTSSMLAVLLRENGDYAAARPLFERVVAITEKQAATDDPVLAWRLAEHATLLSRLGHHAAAESINARAVAIAERSLGADHPYVGWYLGQHARSLLALGNLDAALETALRAERIGREHLRVTVRTLPERQALGYGFIRASGLETALAIASMEGRTGESVAFRVWDALVRSRAVVLDEIAARHRSLGAATRVVRLAEAYSESQQRLANLLVRGQGAQTPEQYRALLDEARGESERAEQALGNASAVFQEERSLSQAGLDDVVAALPRGSVLVSYAQCEPGPAPIYVAFALDVGTRTPTVVPLPTVAAVDSLVARWRVEMSGPGRGSDNEAACAAAGAALRRAIWDPIVPAIGGASRIFIVPEGALHLVNLTSLPADGGGYLIERGPAVHYLSAERDLIRASKHVPSGDGLLVLGDPDYDRATPDARVASTAALPDSLPGEEVAVSYRGSTAACAEFERLRWTRLPGTALEIDEVLSLWNRHAAGLAGDRSSHGARPGSPPPMVLTDAQASEGSFKQIAPGRRIVHLATHGFFVGKDCPAARSGARGIGGLSDGSATIPAAAPRGENPLLLSGLALAGANHRQSLGPGEEDGILTAEEIAALDLSGVEWAVLSACETGLGEIHPGEGVFGLRRAFQVAGAGTLIMSLWPVEDETTREWMRDLYEAHLIRNRGAADAVRDASLQVLERRRGQRKDTHPFYWGAFVAAGAWQ